MDNTTKAEDAAKAAKAEEAVKAEAAAKKKDPKRVALIDKYLDVYPAAAWMRADLIADSTMDGSKIAAVVRKFMDIQVIGPVSTDESDYVKISREIGRIF